ncbi:MAG: bacteriohemerythrin [Lawsonibacter sp.]|jgi:hemerythrin
MRYELTQDLVTGNALIDSEHKQLFAAINTLLDACAQGKGRDKLVETTQFLNSYVNKHFGDEEKLQQSSRYPGYSSHKIFHDGYRRQLLQATEELMAEGPSVKALGRLNQMVGVLISHIRTEDRKLAKHVQENR